MEKDRLSRRRFVSVGGAISLLGLSGCLRFTDGDESTPGTPREDTDNDGEQQSKQTETTSTATLTPSSTETEPRSPAETTTTMQSATRTDTRTSTPTDTPTATPTDTPTAIPTDTPTATPTDTPTATPTARPSVFSDISIEEENLVIELNSDRASEVESVRVKFPTMTDTKNMSGFTLTRINLLGHADKRLPGNWTIEALSGSGSVIESTDYETEFDISLSDIGTLSELGVIGEDKSEEHNRMQLTFTNDGQMPIDLVYNVDEFSSTYGFNYTISGDRATESSETTVFANESVDLQYNFVREDDVSRLAGDTYQASVEIGWSARGSETVPLDISFGENVKYDSERHQYAEGTTVSRR